MGHLPAELDLPDFDFFAWDARGHGRSPGARGDSPSFGTSVRDVQTFIAHIGEHHGFAPESIAVIAQSVGAVVAAAWVHDYAPPIRGMVLASPAFKVKLYVPLALPGLRLMRALRGNFFVTSYVKARLLTRDPERAASYDTDPLIARSISVNILLGLQQTSDRIVADAAAITVPTQLLMSDRDWVVHDGPQHAFFERLGSATKEKHVLQGFYHDTLGERDRAIGDRSRADVPARSVRAPAGARRSRGRRSARIHEGRSRCAALAAAREFAARPLLARHARDVALRRDAVGRPSHRPRERIRFRQHARLRLSQCRGRAHAAGPPCRSHLSRLGGLARHPAAQAPRRGAAPRGDLASARERPARPHRRRCRRPRPLRARRDRRAARVPTRSCCATTARQTSARAPR